MESIQKIFAQWSQVASSLEFENRHTEKEMDWYKKNFIHQGWQPYQKIAQCAIHPGNAHEKSAHPSLWCYLVCQEGHRKSTYWELDWASNRKFLYRVWFKPYPCIDSFRILHSAWWQRKRWRL